MKVIATGPVLTRCPRCDRCRGRCPGSNARQADSQPSQDQDPGRSQSVGVHAPLAVGSRAAGEGRPGWGVLDADGLAGAHRSRCKRVEDAAAEDRIAVWGLSALEMTSAACGGDGFRRRSGVVTSVNREE